MLSDYLNQGMALRRKIGTDGRGQPVYGPVQAVKCRKQRRGRFQMNGDHALRVQETIYYTKNPIFEGDMIDGAVVRSVDDWVGVRGEVIGHKVVL